MGRYSGLEKVKKVLKEQVIFPVQFPNQFQKKQKPVKSILFMGLQEQVKL